jgi:hypothetical protein
MEGTIMMRATTVVLLALFCVAAVGCAAAREEQQRELSAPTANAAGTWTGYAGSGGTSIPVTLTLNQSGTNLTGNLTVAGRPDFSGPVTGTVQGELVKLSLATATFAQMRVQQDTMSGQGSVGPVNLRRSK